MERSKRKRLYHSGFSIEPSSSSKTDERIALEAIVTSSTIEINGEQGEQVETPPAPIAKAPQLADGHSVEQQEVIDYAWQVSNGDMRFLYLLTAENGEYSHRRVHPKVAGTTGTDHGLCGINDHYHSDIIRNSKFLDDWHWQLEQCYNLYEGGTTFYGIIRYDKDPNHRMEIHNKFKS
jgi:hypothetical protein